LRRPAAAKENPMIVRAFVRTWLVIGLGGLAAAAYGGPVNPPAGPVGPTYKTLSEVQPRRPVQSLPGDATTQHIISQPGSYYLTGDIVGVSGKSAIRITSDRVTLDLCGFTVRGVEGALHGIHIMSRSEITIGDGILTGWPQTSIEAGTSTHVRLERLRVSGSGKSGLSAGWGAMVIECEAWQNADYGIFTNNDSIVERCKSSSNGIDGFRTGHNSVVAGCISGHNGGDGFLLGSSMVVSGCMATSNVGVGLRAEDNLTLSGSTFSGNLAGGVLANSAATITSCTFTGNTYFGLKTQGASALVSGCTARGNHGDGINVNSMSTVMACLVQQNQRSDPPGAGIRFTGQGNRADSNSLVGNGIGILMVTSGNLVVRNSFSFNPQRIQGENGNNVAAMVVTPGVGFNNSNPWANFAH
jgi:hypothetical protein